jgi:hypothetical protein
VYALRRRNASSAAGTVAASSTSASFLGSPVPGRFVDDGRFSLSRGGDVDDDRRFSLSRGGDIFCLTVAAPFNQRDNVACETPTSADSAVADFGFGPDSFSIIRFRKPSEYRVTGSSLPS